MRAKVFGTADFPRLSIFRSNRFVFAQIIDDAAHRTLLSLHSKTVRKGLKGEKSIPKSDMARAVGKELAHQALEKRIKRITFDRGGYRYQGRVRAFAEGAREGGLEF